MTKITELEDKIKWLTNDRDYLRQILFNLSQKIRIGTLPCNCLMNEYCQSFAEKSVVKQEQEAVDFINQSILTKLPKKGEFQAEGLWDGLAKVLIDKLKQVAISYAGKALEHLKEQIVEQGIEQAINLADFALENIQDFLFEKYQSTFDEKQKEIFKNKIIEKFPESGLASKLRNE